MTTEAFRALLDKSRSEDDVQKDIIARLSDLGFLVLESSRRRKRCQKCGEWSAGGDGATPGLPDLFVTWLDWPPLVFVGLEVKGPKTAVSPEQERLFALCRIAIVRSVEDAFRALAHAAAAGNLPLPPAFAALVRQMDAPKGRGPS